MRLSLGGWLYSLYGVKLNENWDDATFRYCAQAHYGTYFFTFLRELSCNCSFVDIGANLGVYSLIASQNKRIGRVYSFEPNPFVYEFLMANAALNSADISAFQVAIAAKEGSQMFSFDSAHTGAGGLTTKEGRKIQVTCRNFSILDEIQNSDDSDKLVKIDVEGSELAVIGELFKSKMGAAVRYLYFEASEDLYDVHGLKRLLEARGFRLLHKNGSGRLYDLMYERES